MTTLQKHAESQPVTDPYPERQISRADVLLAQCDRKPIKTRQRGGWRWLRAFLPLLIVAAAGAETVIIDPWGTVVARYPWPQDHDIVIPVPGPVLPPEGWPLQPNSYYRQPTPQPTPIKTPVPVQQPNTTPKPA